MGRVAAAAAAIRPPLMREDGTLAHYFTAEEVEGLAKKQASKWWMIGRN